MKQLLKLTLLQLKDKIDFSWVKSIKTVIRTIVFGILKFVAVAAVAYLVLYLLNFIRFISVTSDVLPLFTVFLALVVIMNLGSSTYNLMKSLYFADDNKVLITFPVTANKMFFSKLLVYYVFELKKSLGLLVPGIIGFLIFEYNGNNPEVTFWVFLWLAIPLVLLVLVTVLFASILSIPFLYIYRFIKKYPLIDLIGVIILTGVSLFVIIKLISLIPENIDLNVQWPTFKANFSNFIGTIARNAYPINEYAKMFFGEISTTGGAHYQLTWLTFVKTAIVIGSIGVLGLLVFLLIKPFYFTMMNKTFEFDKNPNLVQKKNILHRKYVTFANKEFKLSFRDFDVSGSYLVIYIIVPILLYFMDRVISAFSTSLRGDTIAIAVNLILTILPLLASNSMIATFYSKEGRTAYITKTNPVDPLIPLTSKLLFNLFFSIPSIIGCSVIFANFSGLGVGVALAFGFSVLLLQYAHIFFCAAQDIMNPQNEVYATTGSDFNNPNETRATIVAFIGSAILTLLFFFMLQESYKFYENYNSAFLRLFVVSAALFAGFLYLFIKKIKAFYYEK